MKNKTNKDTQTASFANEDSGIRIKSVSFEQNNDGAIWTLSIEETEEVDDDEEV